MKKKLIISLCFLLVAVMTVPYLTSCSDNRGETVMSYGDVSISENLYFYELALMKSETLQKYTGSITDVPAVWTQVLGEDVTFDDYTYLECQVNIKTRLYFADYALQHDADLTSEEKKEIETQLDKIVDQFGSKEALNKYLETYYMDYKMLEEYYELYALYNKGLSMAFSEGGGHQIPVEDAYQYYKNNFVTVKHIAVGTELAGADEDGNYIYYTEEEKALKQEAIDTIAAALESGEDFDKYIGYSEDGFADNYPNGYTITRGVLDDAMDGYENVAFSLKEGEWDTFELEGMGVYFIKRVPILESDFSNCYSTIMTNLLQVKMAQIILDKNDEFTVNEEIVDRYNMAMIPVIT